MANYYMNISHGTVGKGLPHSEYILGQGKYEYKDKEVQYVSNNLPSWANSEKDFWETADLNERANGRSYTELKLSLPNDLDLENNINLLDDFIEESLGKNHYYTVAIHDKESSYRKGVQNIHAHVMFSERKLDGIERSRDLFFKQANTKNPSKGGCKKDRYWKSKDRLLELRKLWEVKQNQYLENINSSERVSCETLKKQKQEALENGNNLKAELLDREPINLKGHLIHKKNRTPEEENQFNLWVQSRELKTLKEEVYILSLEQQKEIAIEEFCDVEEEIKSVLPFSNILDKKSDIEMLNLEIEKVKYENTNLEKIKPLELTLETLKEEYKELVIELTPQDLEDYTKVQTFETNQMNYNKYLDLENLKKDLKFKENKINNLNNPEKIELSALNILTKNKYSKLMNINKDLNGKIKSLNHSLMFAKNRKEDDTIRTWKNELKESNIRLEKNELKLKPILNLMKDKDFKNKKIRIESSISKKLENQLSKNLFKQYETSIELDILKTKVDLIPNKNEIVEGRIKILRSEIYSINEKIEKIDDKLSYIPLEFKVAEKKAYNEITDNKLDNLLKEYEKVSENLQKAKIEAVEIPKINFLKRNRISKEISNLKNRIESLEQENRNLKNSIPDTKLYSKIIEIKDNHEKEFNKEIKPILNKERRELSASLSKKNIELKINTRILEKLDNDKTHDLKRKLKPLNKSFNNFKKANQPSGHSSINLWKQERDKELEDNLNI